jgi:hypothetical protein
VTNLKCRVSFDEEQFQVFLARKFCYIAIILIQFIDLILPFAKVITTMYFSLPLFSLAMFVSIRNIVSHQDTIDLYNLTLKINFLSLLTFLTQKFGDLLRENCLIFFSIIEFEDGRGDSSVECELRGQDLQGSFYKTVKIDTMTMDWAQANGIESGVTTLFATNAMIDETKSKLEIPADGNVEVSKNSWS